MRKAASRELKAGARMLLPGKYGFFAFLTMAVTLLNLVFNLFLNDFFMGGGFFGYALYFVSALIVNILYTLLLAGQQRIYLKTADHEPCSLRDLFYAFRNHPEALAVYAVIQSVLMTILYNLTFAVLDVLLFGASGRPALYLAGFTAFLLLFVWLQLGLAAVMYLYNDTPWNSGRTLLKQSWSLMKGNRLRYLYVQLSFLILDLLGVLSFGTGFLFVDPYRRLTLALFYRNLTEPQQAEEQNNF